MRSSLPVLKADGERRFTLGVAYQPNALDSQGEWVEPDVLQDAMHDFALRKDLRLRLQHDERVEVGHIVEIFTLPWEWTVELAAPGMEKRRVKLNAGTVLMGVKWDPEPWEKLVKTGRVRGYSIGGRAIRVDAELPTSKAARETFFDAWVRGRQITLT